MLQCLKEPTLPFSWTEQNTRWRAGPLASSEVKATPSTFELGRQCHSRQHLGVGTAATSRFPTQVALFFLAAAGAALSRTGQGLASLVTLDPAIRDDRAKSAYRNSNA